MLLILLQSQSAAVTHDTSGALTGQGASVAGDATRFRAFDTTGALAGQGASVTGDAARASAHDTSGVLTGSGASVTGDAARAVPVVEVSWLEIEAGVAAHDATGALTGQGSTVTGDANRTREHATTGVLAGQGSTLSGSANRFRAFATSGVLTGQGSTLSGSASRFRAFATSGVLVGQGSTITGDAARAGAAVVHDTTGVLTGPNAIIVGDAQVSGAASLKGEGWYDYPPKKRKSRDFKRERDERDELRKQIVAAIEPVTEKTATVVTMNDKVAVVTETGPSAFIPIPPSFDTQAVVKMVMGILEAAGIEAQRARDAQARQQARQAYELAMRELERRRLKRRREEELLLLM